MKEFFKSDVFLKIALVIGFAVLLLIFFSSTSKDQEEISKSTETEQRIISMITVLCDGEVPEVMIKTDKDELTILGVGIIIKSAEDPVIKEKILELTSKVLDVSPARICVTT